MPSVAKSMSDRLVALPVARDPNSLTSVSSGYSANTSLIIRIVVAAK